MIICNLKAMLGWFPEWQSDWCADFRADGIKKMTLLFYAADSKTFFGLKIGRLLTKIQPLLCSNIWHRISIEIGCIKTGREICHESFKNTPQNFFFLSLFFFFFFTDRKKNILFKILFNFFIFERRTVWKGLMTNPPSRESSKHGLT